MKKKPSIPVETQEERIARNKISNDKIRPDFLALLEKVKEKYGIEVIRLSENYDLMAVVKVWSVTTITGNQGWGVGSCYTLSEAQELKSVAERVLTLRATRLEDFSIRIGEDHDFLHYDNLKRMLGIEL